MKIKNMISSNGNKVANQFIIIDNDRTIFQSYDSIIAIEENGKKTLLDKDKWNCSQITGEYRNQFLGETIKETRRKIKSGEYILTNLNK